MLQCRHVNGWYAFCYYADDRFPTTDWEKHVGRYDDKAAEERYYENTKKSSTSREEEASRTRTVERRYNVQYVTCLLFCTSR